ncbi:hypothetical protein [Maridesulfovibrio zosterae]|uniref:hypothetical protein n=1 Tax=Maridesulfovibrio zosterae TaxID=82171 RepID=UPI001FE00EA1|nr:hypothetical protein [Maridesulfovibrio zosterae]
MNWKLAISFPQTGIAGLLKGRIQHIQNTEFKFNGQFTSSADSFESGPIKLRTNFKTGMRNIELNNTLLHIHNLKFQLPELNINNPDIIIKGNGTVDTVSEKSVFHGLNIKIGTLPTVRANLEYSPYHEGSLTVEIVDPLPLLKELANRFYTQFSEWDKTAELGLTIKINHLRTTPEAYLRLDFKKLSTASPDGNFLVDGSSGSFLIRKTLDSSKFSASIELSGGEALLNTFYIDLNNHPFKAKLDSTLPNRKGNISAYGNINWHGLGKFSLKGKLTDLYKNLKYSAELHLRIDQLKDPFKLFAVDPLSLGDISADGQLTINADINGGYKRTDITGNTEIIHGTFTSNAIEISGIKSQLPFTIILGENFKPQLDDSLTTPDAGFIEIAKIDAKPIIIKNFKFPLTISSNEVEFGNLPQMDIEGGTLKLSDLNIKNPFSDKFILHGIVDAKNINMLAFSPESLPVDGEIDGDMEFWLLKDHLSTNGELSGVVYSGNMTISEIYAENLFEPSRQYGADFHVKNLDLAPLSKALDIGRITGRMDLDLNDLVIAYDQPASFRLYAITTPESDSSRNISLKAVNTLSVIGTGSGLTGAGVGMFSSFFKEFSYAGLGLECTLDDDLFKIRGLIREDGIEYIIKKPPLFGINVVNSNPKNLISFSDMLKRLKRVINN